MSGTRRVRRLIPMDAWERWQRPGLNQFRMAHIFLGGFRAVLDAELPAVSKALQDAGGLRLNFIRDVLPAKMTGGWRDGDERYQWLTGRRVVVEAVHAAAAESTPGVEIRRGTTVAGLEQRRFGAGRRPARDREYGRRRASLSRPTWWWT